MAKKPPKIHRMAQEVLNNVRDQQAYKGGIKVFDRNGYMTFQGAGEKEMFICAVVREKKGCIVRYSFEPIPGAVYPIDMNNFNFYDSLFEAIKAVAGSEIDIAIKRYSAEEIVAMQLKTEINNVIYVPVKVKDEDHVLCEVPGNHEELFIISLDQFVILGGSQ